MRDGRDHVTVAVESTESAIREIKLQKDARERKSPHVDKVDRCKIEDRLRGQVKAMQLNLATDSSCNSDGSVLTPSQSALYSPHTKQRR